MDTIIDNKCEINPFRSSDELTWTYRVQKNKNFMKKLFTIQKIKNNNLDWRHKKKQEIKINYHLDHNHF